MRKPEYISPSAYKLYMENPENYFLRYLADTKPPRDPQTNAMSIGSAFDAYVKSHLHHLIFGKNAKPQFAFEALFENQVEPQWRDWARLHGKYVFDKYSEFGALADIVLELNGSIGEPRFEFEVRSEIRSYEGSVVLLGKPDIHFTNKHGASVSYDWKVNGYCSIHPQSPKQGYICVKPGYAMHKTCVPHVHQGQLINVAMPLNAVDVDWAKQLAIYGWLCGEDVGSQFVCGIDQIVCNTRNGTLAFPQIRVAQHRCTIEADFQKQLFLGLARLWGKIQNEHFFEELSKEESVSRGNLLSNMAKNMWDAPSNPIDVEVSRLAKQR